MTKAFLPLYPGDYLRDTRHLSLAEKGAYTDLLFILWPQACWMKFKPARLARVMGISEAEFEAIWEEIGGLFDTESRPGWFTQKRLLEEWGKAQARAERARSAAAKRWKSNGGAEPPDDAPGIPQASPKQCSPPSPSPPKPQPAAESASERTSEVPPPASENIGVTDRSLVAPAALSGVITYLNDLSGGRWPCNDHTTEYFRERIQEGATIDDCHLAIEGAAGHGVVDMDPRAIGSTRWFHQLLAIRSAPNKWREYRARFESALERVPIPNDVGVAS